MVSESRSIKYTTYQKKYAVKILGKVLTDCVAQLV